MHKEAAEVVTIGQKVTQANEEVARRNRDHFAAHGLFVVNLMGSPGSGKTSLLERTIPALEGMRVGVVEGDIEGEADRERVEAAGAAAAEQINTYGACHLLAHQVEHAVEHLGHVELDVLFIENVGNLVCPAEFDLGEAARVMVFSVTEGADKPLKYPLMFRKAHVLVVTKTDLLDQSGCDLALLEKRARRINPGLRIYQVSSRTGEGVDDWCAWLRECVEIARQGEE